ncbi:hypothetical protein J2S13_000270 [Oikeobacillus pervagus]|uniref:Resolvase HTH domain-containing protein n=1 Tax=Oikeobacillus pervagus TaxID=1325931 RepID=A0AAJ1T252_9BACI|nr:hypothetical protein [Oikeobacillus pervagus]MDQ0213876.1 hypothetical protein [Oikeobacillus pervagus]
MTGFIIGLVTVAIILFILSFFQQDPYKTIEKELDDLSMQCLQDTYQIKKKLKIIEEELLMGDSSILPETMEVNEIIKNQVIALSNQGIPLDQIAKQSSLSIQQVRQILQPYRQ